MIVPHVRRHGASLHHRRPEIRGRRQLFEYGHMYAGKVNVIEFEVAYSFYKQYGNPGTNGWRMEWAGLFGLIGHQPRRKRAGLDGGFPAAARLPRPFGTGYVQRAREILEDDSRGYTFGAKGQNGEYDCSGLVWCALRDSGYDVSSWSAARRPRRRGFWPWGSTSRTTRPTACARATSSGGISGDAGHTAIYSGDGKLIEAAQDYDGQPGDSGGREIWEHGLYDPGWQKMAHAPASSSGSAAGLHGCAAKVEGLAGGQEYDAANDRQKKVADLAASRAVDSTEYQQYCAKWAGDVVDSALGASTRATAAHTSTSRRTRSRPRRRAYPSARRSTDRDGPRPPTARPTRSATSAYTSATGRSPTTRRSGR